MIGAFKLNLIAKGATVTAVAQVIRYKKGVQAIGNAQISATQSKFGRTSAYFDGTGDQLSVASHTDFAYGSGDFTIEFWGYYTSIASGECFFDQRSTDPQVVPVLYYLNGTNLAYYVNGSNFITGSAVSLNTWHHIAVSRASGTTRLFLDGVLQGSAVTDSNSYVQGGPLIINGRYALDYSPAGYVDELRISKSARYTANFTPSTVPFVNDANTLLLVHCDGTPASTFFEDDNGVRVSNGIQPTGNAQISIAQSKFGGTSLSLDGTTDWLTVNTTQELIAWNSTDYTIEGWFRLNSLTGASYSTNLPTMYGLKFPQAAGNYWSFGPTTAGTVVFYYWNGASNYVTTSGVTISINTWYHIAMVRNGTTIKIYVNGIERASATISGTPLWALDHPMNIGAANSAYFNGYIDELRVSNVARYTATFTPSTVPFVNDANTKLLLHGDGNNASTVIRDDNGVYGKNIIPYGNAQISTAQSKFGGTSLSLDGTGDYLQLASHSDFVFGTGDFTIEGWIRFPSTGAYRTIYCSGGVNGGNMALYLNNTTLEMHQFGGGYTLFTAASGMVINTWYHVALCRAGGTIRWFVDGVVKASQADTKDWTLASGPMIGYDAFSTDWFNGFIDEFRISKTGRYTAAFTPSTVPFVNDANTVFLLHMNGTNASTTFVDNSSRIQHRIGSAGNAQISTAQSKFGGSSLLLDGTGDYLQTESSADFGFGTGDFTLEAWVYDSAYGDYHVIICARQTGLNGSNVLATTSGKLSWSNGSAWQIAATTLPLNQWNHVAASRSNGVLKLFVNGVEDYSSSQPVDVGTGARFITIGAFEDLSGYYSGYIDEIRISDNARYTAAFTPSTTPFVNDANTRLLIHADGTNASTTFIDDNGVVPYTP